MIWREILFWSCLIDVLNTSCIWSSILFLTLGNFLILLKNSFYAFRIKFFLFSPNPISSSFFLHTICRFGFLICLGIPTGTLLFCLYWIVLILPPPSSNWNILSWSILLQILFTEMFKIWLLCCIFSTSDCFFLQSFCWMPLPDHALLSLLSLAIWCHFDTCSHYFQFFGTSSRCHYCPVSTVWWSYVVLVFHFF